jgi:tetratricopeptide (TPR) repeat protein
VAQADPEKSFESAVRHLIRHLNDAVALRRNPLARSRFVPTDRRSLSEDARVLADLRSDMLRVARDIAGSKPESRRHLAIVSGICAGKAPQTIASELGISLPQFYRDRRFICTLVCRVLVANFQRAAVPATVYDPLRLVINRGFALIDQGMNETAVRTLERVVSAAASDPQKVAAQLALSSALIELGNLSEAVSVREDARRNLRTGEPPYGDDATLHRVAGLLDARIAMHEGRHDAGAVMLEELAAKGESEGSGPFDPTAVRISILDYKCRFAMFRDKLPEARASIAQASALAERSPDLIPALRVAVTVSSALVGKEGARNPHERLIPYTHALQLSVSLGSALGILTSSIGLSVVCARLGDSGGANAHAERALEVARSMEGALPLPHAVASLGRGFIQARRSEMFERLLFENDDRAPLGSNVWTMIKLYCGVVLLRRRQFTDALDYLLAAQAFAPESGDLKSAPRCCRSSL